MRITRLLTDSQETPPPLDTPPRFSWQLASDRRGAAQTAFRLLVASSLENLRGNAADLWDSGKLESPDSTHVSYAGKPLASDMTCWWKVRVWDERNVPSPFSRAASFDTALLLEKDWKAIWIGREENPGPLSPVDWENRPPADMERALSEIVVNPESALLRREWVLPKKPVRARLYVCGLGLYELRLNGKRVGGHVLAPLKTDYRKLVLYDSYDVTQQLRAGPNAVCLMLGNGWYNPPGKAYWNWQMQWFGAPRAILQIHAACRCGTTEELISDAAWKTAPGPIVYNCIYDGETYDARLEQPGWDLPGFDDSAWQNAAPMKPPGGRLTARASPATEVIETIAPRSISHPAPGARVFDMGANFAGWARLKVKAHPGAAVKLRFAEDIKKNGELDPATNLEAKAADTYIPRGGESETYEPKFTYHGFRYVEVSAPPDAAASIHVQGRAISAACRPAGRFSCSHSFLNRLHACVKRSQRSCLVMGVPIDCPQRHERLGWLGDAHVTAEEAFYNFDMALFYRKWLRDIGLQQNAAGDIPHVSPRLGVGGTPCWSGGYPVIVWQSYLFTGDKDLLGEHYPHISRYAEFLSAKADGFILPKDRYGDWCSAAEGWTRGDPELAATAYYYLDVTLLARMASILERGAEADAWSNLAGNIRRAFNLEFLDAAAGFYGDGSQCCQVLPLAFGLVPEENGKQVFDALVKDIVERHATHLTTGILGTRHLLDVLSERGRPDLAYNLVLRKGHPSWREMLRSMTTLSENWNRSGSHNHVMFGGVDAWLYRTLAGIRPVEDQPGFRLIRFEPYFPENMNAASASIDTLRGKVAAAWRRSHGRAALALEVPPGCRGELVLPAGEAGPKLVRERDRVVWDRGFTGRAPGVAGGESRNGSTVLRLLSGRFRFTIFY